MPDSSALQLGGGRLNVRCTTNPLDISVAKRFRETCFGAGEDRDAVGFDSDYQHVIVTERASERVVGCLRFLVLEPEAVQKCYTGQFYDLTAFRRFPARLLEVGRFCIAAGQPDPDILRMMWAMIAQQVDGNQIGYLFGCSSFAGTDVEPYRPAFGLLRDRYLIPPVWRPGKIATETVSFDEVQVAASDDRPAWCQIPPLLRSYLTMGGQVSDHAVVDRSLNTLHVFTGLETNRIPESRQRRLRELLASALIE